MQTRDAKPILFSGPMVRAILREIEVPGTGKTTTRRVLKPQPDERRIAGAACVDGIWCWQNGWDGSLEGRIPLTYSVGDILYVREAWAARLDEDHIRASDLKRSQAFFWADGPAKCCNTGCAGAAGRVRAAMHLPRRLSRLSLEVTAVKIERLQDISYEDIIAEGWQIRPEVSKDPQVHRDAAKDWFTDVWDEIYGVGEAHEHSWTNNPWVIAPVFKPHLQNVDDFLKGRAA